MNKTVYTVDLGMGCIKIVGFGCLFLAAFIGHAQEVISVKQGGAAKEVIVVPATYKIDSGVKKLGSESTVRVSKKDNEQADFAAQLQEIGAQALTKGGNLLRIARMEDHKQTGRYRFWAEVYHTDKYDQLKAKINAGKNKKAQERFGYITIYRPTYILGFNDDSIRYDVMINDTLALPMQGNTRYILRVSKEGSVRITVKHKDFVQNVQLDVKMGKDYYVRNYTNFPGAKKYIKAGDMQVRVRGYSPYLDIVGEEQGAIESSLVTKVVVNKNI